MQWFHHVPAPRAAETLAFAATLLCVWVSAQAAVHAPRRSPHLLMALALFALNWAILLLYYLPGPPQDGILPAFSGFTLIYVGIVLLRETRPRLRSEDSGLHQSRSGQSPFRIPHSALRGVGWMDTLPPHLLRLTVTGFGIYLVLKRVWRVEYGYSTLALAIWGTLITVLGYASVWNGVRALYGDRWRGGPAVACSLLLLTYAGCEVAYSTWYGREYWPVYHRYLLLEARPEAPRLDQVLPLEPQADWPEAPKWAALRHRPDWKQVSDLLGLKPEPRLPKPWPWLTYALSVLKITFTGLFLGLVWRRPQQ
jgi:hypothetical protein